MTTLNRREFIRRMAATAAFTAAGTAFPGIVFPARQVSNISGVDWHKAPCRFCGVGCGLLVGISNGRAVAVKGDPASPVNRGLCCVKGYHVVQTLYGSDRLTQAMVRAAHARFLPRTVVVQRPVGDAAKALVALVPYAAKLVAKDGKPTAYLCQGYVCKTPVQTLEGLVKLLDAAKAPDAKPGK